MKIMNPLMAILLISSVTNMAYADQYHYKDILIGDRASGFAGAYTAIADDPSGLYYNPAGVVRAPDGQLSASANAYNLTQYTYKDVNASGKDWVRKSNASLANFFGVFQPLGKGVFGFSIAAPDVSKASQDETFHNYAAADASWAVEDEVLNYKEDDFTMLVGPSYSVGLSDNFSIGATLYMHIRNMELEFRQRLKLSKTGESDAQSSVYQKYKTNEYALKPVLGMIWDASSELSVGLKLSKTFMLSQNPMAQQESWSELEKDSQTGLFTPVTNFTFPDPIGMAEAEDRELPAELSLGVAWFASPYFILSSDVDYFSETSTYDSVLNWSVGSEYFWSPKLSTRLGAYTNHSNNKDLNQLVDGKRATGFDVDQYGMTMNISKHNRLSVMTLGVNYAQGTGKAQLSQEANNTQDIDVQSITAYIATSMNF